MTDTAVHISGLSKSYGQIQALRGLDLEIPRGGIFGIVGPNGAGKTTLFAILCGYIRPTSGHVKLHDKPVVRGQSLPIRVATYPQDSLMLEGLNVKRHLIYYARLDGFSKAEATNEASRVLHMVKLPEVWERHPKNLSHGQRKRVGLAQAFLGAPDLVILDEPTAGLDPESARQIRAAIREVAVDRTVLISSHDLDQVQALCSEVAILDKGRVAGVEAMARLAETSGKVSFKLTAQPSIQVVQEIEALAYVISAAWDDVDARLRIECHTQSMTAEAASGELVQLLVSRQVRFTDLQVGERLSDVVRDETA